MERYNSNRNQYIKGKFVDREVFAPATAVVEFILKISSENTEAPFNYDDITNLYVYEDMKGIRYSKSKKAAKLEALGNALTEAQEQRVKKPNDSSVISKISALKDEMEALESSDQEMQEIYEWWIVSSYLARKLEDHGEPTLSDGQAYYWGRCSSGQAILLDDVINRICEELQILEGQLHQWKE